MKGPKVTVFVPVYNGQRYINETIESVLAQDFGDFELLIIDDGSSDNTVEIIRQREDHRIRLLINEVNKGISFTRNRAVKEARGTYLALLDADDIALPQRIGRQAEYLDRHPEIAACGSHAAVIDESGHPAGKNLRVPVDKDEISARLAFENVFINSSLMFRLDVLRTAQGYADQLCEDYEMSVRLSFDHELTNLDEVLVKYRMHQNSTSRIREDEMRSAERKVVELIHRRLGLERNASFVFMHQSLAMDPAVGSDFSIEDYQEMLIALRAANLRQKLFPVRVFNRLLFKLWYEKIRQKGGRRGLPLLFSAPLFEWDFLTFKMIRKLIKQSVAFGRAEN